MGDLPVTLQDLVDIDVLNDISDKFSKVTGIASEIIDARGKILTKNECCSSFCKYLRSSREGLERCTESCRINGLKAKIKGEPVHYTCHAGLTDVVAPIIVHGHYLGAFLCGQVVIKGREPEPEAILKNTCNMGLDESTILKYYRDIKVVDVDALYAAGEMMAILTRYIAENSLSKIILEKLLAEARGWKYTDIKNFLIKYRWHSSSYVDNQKISLLLGYLNTINSVAMAEGATNTQDLICSFSNILRGVTSDRRFVSLDEGVSYIKDYLNIMGVRYGQRVYLTFDNEDSLMYIKLPRLLLLSIIECLTLRILQLINEEVFIKLSIGRNNDKLNLMISFGLSYNEPNVNKDYSLKSTGNTSKDLLEDIKNRACLALRDICKDEYGVEVKEAKEQPDSLLVSIPIYVDICSRGNLNVQVGIVK